MLYGQATFADAPMTSFMMLSWLAGMRMSSRQIEVANPA
jgi:hypothetical protein